MNFLFLRRLFLILGVLSAALSAEESSPTNEPQPTQQVEKSLPARTSQAETLEPPSWSTSDDTGMGHFFSELTHMLLALGAIVGFMFAVAWVLKRLLNTRMRQMNTTSLIKILERRSLTPKCAVYLLEICGKGIVIAEFPNGVKRLAEIDLPPDSDLEVKSAEQKPGFSPFAKIMQEKQQRSE